MLPKKPALKAEDQGGIPNDFEQTMEAFAVEFEQENKQLMNVILEMKQAHAEEVGGLKQKLQKLEMNSDEMAFLKEQISWLKEQRFDQAARTVQPAETVQNVSETIEPEAEAVAEAEMVPEEQPMEKQTMKQRYSELFELHEQGKSVEYIAKKLSMNKGEVQLIIGLAEREEDSRV